jgi:hypothetical protein
MRLSPDTLREIEGFVRSGFEERDRIIEIICQERYAPGELDEAEVTAAVDAAFASLARDKTTWPTTTDCDRLDGVFAALNTRGIIALQNAGYTQSDGYDDVVQIYAERSDRDTIIRYCFYHGQDLDRAVQGQGLHLAFGPMDAQKEQTEGPRIGAMIADELTRAGFAVTWNGTFAQRIFVPVIDWKRRRSPLQVTTADGRVLNNPSAVNLHDLLANMNFRYPFLIVERSDLLPLGEHYIQIHMDLDIDPDKGRGYFIEYRDGGPDLHFRAIARDDAPWDSAWSPAFERVVKVVQDWAFRRDGWREAMPWERIDLGG